ncbi:MAG: ABC transporter permease [Actinomycetota bacterium]|nr:ABC transporter permease [Actinomycetota bacterium]
MLFFVGRRLAQMVPILFGVTVISFLLLHLTPGGPVEAQTGLSLKSSAAAKENLRKLYGLDKPIHVQYVIWVKRLARLDFGKSFTDGRDVLQKIEERIPITLKINILSMMLMLAAAVPLGITSATRQHTFFDKLTTIGVFVGYSTPTFWLALLLMILFGVELGILPIAGIHRIDTAGMGTMALALDEAKHLILPVFVSAFGGIAGFSRYMRSSMLEVIRQDYIRTARAKGLPEGVVIKRHALRNALMPMVTILGLSVPGLIGGSVIFETIFSIPGMGQLYFSSIMERDYPTVMAMLVIFAVLTQFGNLLADLAYGLVDPRIRVAGR